MLSRLAIGPRERVLAWAVDDNSGSYVVATTEAIVTVSADAKAADRRAWHLVDAGGWQDEVATLTVTWVDGHRPTQWTFAGQRTLVPETLRERVQASVVLSQRLALGDRRTARVAIRQDLSTRELLPQVIYGRGTRADDPAVVEQVQSALADLKDQVGLAR